MTEQVPNNDRALPERKRIKEALRGTGLSVRQVDALLRGGWRLLVGDTQAEADELRDTLEAFKRRLETSG